MARGLMFCLFVVAAAAASPAEELVTSCVACHGDDEVFSPEETAMVAAFSEGVHAEAGLSCHDCHGGNPEADFDDMDAAMDEHFGAGPYRGAPGREEVPGFCGSCHSDPDYMRRFRPDIRVDQEQEYWTSHHGRGLSRGDERVATCIDCHGVHGILGIEDPRSPVYPSRVAETCGSCHGDSKIMAGSVLADGRPLPVDQFARWSRSVHARSLLENGDLSAPTCNDCHGNHGATPPGLDSIAFVCGQCHGREAELFRASPKQELHREHNEYLAEAGGEGCVACHEAPEPQVELTTVHSFSECVSCHGQHAVVRPTVAMLSPLPDTPCAFCHQTFGTLGEEFPEPVAPGRNFESTLGGLLAKADPGLDHEERFDWLVDQALALPFHSLSTSSDDGRTSVLRPEFERLFTKFRIGKTYYTYEDADSGEEVQASVRRCSDCHGPEPILGESTGHDLARTYLDSMWELTSLIARAERMLLAARRGGVETSVAASEIDRAVDSQIELEVLVHGFSTEPESPFLEKHSEGIEHAGLALEASRLALDDLRFRRAGLMVSLSFVVLLLFGLGIKIRQLPIDEE